MPTNALYYNTESLN